MKHFNFNKTMVWLDESVYPKEILESMKKHTLNHISCDVSPIEESLQLKQSNIDDTLENI